MRHQLNQKSFALIYERDGLCVNLKCDPRAGPDFLRQMYRGVDAGLPYEQAALEHGSCSFRRSRSRAFGHDGAQLSPDRAGAEKARDCLHRLQASGKSSFYRENFSSYAHVNLDTLKTRGMEKTLLTQCLRTGRSFVADNTNPTLLDRQRYIAPAKEAGYRVTGYFFLLCIIGLYPAK